MVFSFGVVNIVIKYMNIIIFLRPYFSNPLTVVIKMETDAKQYVTKDTETTISCSATPDKGQVIIKGQQSDTGTFSTRQHCRLKSS